MSLGIKYIHKTFVFQNLQQIEEEPYINDQFIECIIYITSPTYKEPFSLINDEEKLINTMVIRRQETPASDMTPFVLGFTHPSEDKPSKCVYTSGGEPHELMDNAYKNLTNNFYCPSDFKGSMQQNGEIFTGQLYHVSDLDFSSFFYFQRDPNTRVEANEGQTINFNNLSHTTFSEPIEFKPMGFQPVIKSMPVCNVKFKNNVIIDGEIQEGTTISVEGQDLHIIVKNLCLNQATSLRELKTEGIKKLSFINGQLKFYKNDENEVKVQFSNIIFYNSEFDTDKIKADKIHGGMMKLM